MSRRIGVSASEMVSSRSVARPVANVIVAVGSAPRLLVAAPQMSRPKGHKQASQVRVLSAMSVDGFMGVRGKAELAGLAEIAELVTTWDRSPIQKFLFKSIPL